MSESLKERQFDNSIDREVLISLVEERPVLWNKFLDSYRDKAAKTQAWREICVILNSGFREMQQNDRQIFGKCVIKRWTQIRDAWVKSISTLKMSKKTLGFTPRPYRFHEKLNFLMNIVEPVVVHDSTLITTNNVKQEALSEENNSEHSEVTKNRIGHKEANDASEKNRKTTENQKSAPPPSRKRKYSNELDAKMMSLLDKQLAKDNEEEEEDRNLFFFRSLLPSLKTFDDDQTLEFQSGVINLIQTIKRIPHYTDWTQGSEDTPGFQDQVDEDYSVHPEETPSAASISPKSEPEIMLEEPTIST